jgi:uncharacterized protein YqgQ
MDVYKREYGINIIKSEVKNVIQHLMFYSNHYIVACRPVARQQS